MLVKGHSRSNQEFRENPPTHILRKASRLIFTAFAPLTLALFAQKRMRYFRRNTYFLMGGSGRAFEKPRVFVTIFVVCGRDRTRMTSAKSHKVGHTNKMFSLCRSRIWPNARKNNYNQTENILFWKSFVFGELKGPKANTF